MTGEKSKRGKKKPKAVVGDPVQLQDQELGSPAARIAYRCALYGLIPLAGLVLGPLTVGFGAAALRYELSKVGAGRVWTAIALMFVGAIIVLGNWGGLAMMAYGLFFEGR